MSVLLSWHEKVSRKSASIVKQQRSDCYVAVGRHCRTGKYRACHVGSQDGMKLGMAYAESRAICEDWQLTRSVPKWHEASARIAGCVRFRRTAAKEASLLGQANFRL